MSIESLLPSFSDLGSLSLVVLLSAAGLFYFGKLILDVKVEQQEQTSTYYSQGLTFSLGYIALPFVAVLLIANSFEIDLPILASMILQLIILLILSYALTVNATKYTLFSRFVDAFTVQFGVQKKESRFVEFADKRVGDRLVSKSINIQEKFRKGITNIYAIFVLSFVILLTLFSVITKSPTLISPEPLLILIMSFFNFTILALTFGYIGIYHPPATIILDNGEKITGRIVKIRKFVYFINETDGKKYFVNSNKILYVEESMFKEEFIEKLKTREGPSQAQNESGKLAT